MAIDPQIALGVQAPVIQNPVDTQEKFENVQAQAEARRAIADQRNQQTQALIQKARDQAAINAALQRNNGDLRGAGDDLTQGGYGTLGQGLYEQYTAQQQKLAAATEAATKAHQAQLDFAAKIIGSIDPAHPEQYGPAVKAFKATLTDPADLQAMNQIAPDNASPEDVPGIVDRLNKMQIGAKALFDQHSKYVDGFLKGEYTPNLAGVLAITPQADRANALKMLTAQVPDYQTAQALQQQFLPLLNAPPNVIWQAGMTPEQRAQQANQAQTRADIEAAQAETARHNRAQEGIEAQKAAQAANPEVGPEVETTSLGNKWVDLGKFNTNERPGVRTQAANAGATVIADKNAASHLRDIETARMNQQAVMNDIQSSLPTDATGRVVAAPGIVMSKVLQTDESRAAFNSWRTTAIGTLKALAGGQGSGLRINQAEIAMSLANDIPQLTDTLATAQKKMANIKIQLDNAERGILGKKSGDQFTHQPVPGHPGVFASSTDGGKTWKVDGGS